MEINNKEQHPMLEKDREKRISALLEGMSLRQKIGQMTMAERMSITPEEVGENALGAVLCGGGSHPGGNEVADWVAMNDAYWRAVMAREDGPRIPVLVGVDAVHGHGNLRGATVFPHNIGLGAAADPGLVAEIARATAKEILASGIEWNFAPALSVVRNCKWGRTYESFGSDPELVARLGASYVDALQKAGVIGCVKHWVGDGGTWQGMDQGETTAPWEELEATHIAPYYSALKQGVMSVMVSFNSWNGDKCHGHHFLITELLKEKLGFGGIVLSDWDGIDYLDKDYGVAIRKSVNAGLDMFMISERWREFIDTFERQVADGHVSIARINDAVGRILRVKLRCGLFDLPRPSERPGTGNPGFASDAHRELARRAARQSQVLLKNERGALPLDRGQRILVAGKNAHNLGHQCGGWTVTWQGEAGNGTIEGETIWEGIRALAPNAELGDSGEADPERHDIAVVVIGEKPYAEGHGDIRPGDHLFIEAGSRINGLMNPIEAYATTLVHSEVHPEDLACIRHIAAKGIPVVTVLISGRPLIVDAELAESAAFVAGWLPGAGGRGVAEVLLGDREFSGRLPTPWPGLRNQDGLLPKAGAVFPLGHGLRCHAERKGPGSNSISQDCGDAGFPHSPTPAAQTLG
ncbi:MAG: glycoside hydrolase family 3 protein [Gammaproteobacteria bacterium]|nr:glycoside hydrolase family 3 protein [Gammaproteobacteria bacterium]